MATVLWWIMVPFYIVACLALVIIVLLQKGKGVGFAGAFGVGSGSDTLFGPRTAQSFVHKLTYVGAGVFMVLALVMALISGNVGRGSAPDVVEKPQEMQSPALSDVLGETPAPATDTTPAVTTEAITVPATAPVETSAPVEVTVPVEAPAPVETPAAQQ